MTNLKYASSSTQRSRLLRGGETYHFAPLALLAKPRSTRVTMCKPSLFDALTDGLLLLRGMFGLDGSALVTGTIASDATYSESVDIESRIATLGDLADIDGNGEIDALTDGLLTLRYLFGLEGDTLIAGVVASDATRTTSVDIEAYLKTLMPAL